jgi:hypothetical protein
MGERRANRERDPGRSKFDDPGYAQVGCVLAIAGGLIGEVIATVALFVVHPTWVVPSSLEVPGGTIGWVVAVLASLLIGWVVALRIAVLVGPFAAVGLGRLLELAPRLEPLAEPAFIVTPPWRRHSSPPCPCGSWRQ